MDVRITDQQRTNSIPNPGTRLLGQDLEGDDEREHVELAHEHDQEAVIDLLAEPGPEDELDQEKDISRHGEKVRLEDVEAESS